MAEIKSINGYTLKDEAARNDIETIETTYASKSYVEQQIKNIESVPGEKGEQGEKGEKGDKGEKGEKGDSFTYDDLTDEQKADLTQGFITCSNGVIRIEVVTSLPEVEEPGVLYIVKE